MFTTHTDFPTRTTGSPQRAGQFKFIGLTTPDGQIQSQPLDGDGPVFMLASSLPGLAYNSGIAVSYNDSRLDLIPVLTAWSTRFGSYDLTLVEQFFNR